MHGYNPPGMRPGLYRLEISVESNRGVALEDNELDFAVNQLPKSLLIFAPTRTMTRHISG